MAKQMTKKLVLQDGTEYAGYGFGADCERVTELVFDTSMCGYQEIISDPAYTGQTVLMTYPLIGNYGITDEDYESKSPTCGGLIVREYNDNPSNFRYTKTLAETMEEYGIPGIAGFDTRELTRKIRDHGAQKCVITAIDTPTEKAVAMIRETDPLTGLVPKVSSKKIWYARTANHQYNVVVVDLGVRLSIVHTLNALGCNVTVVPYKTDAETILNMKANGVVLSGGPGSPAELTGVVDTVRELIGKIPIFATGLGNEIVGMAYGATCYKLGFGHHGGNHPIRDLENGHVETIYDNHMYALDRDSVEKTKLTVVAEDILDKTVAAVRCEKDKVYAVQYHPTTVAGPCGRLNCYETFVNMMKEGL